MKKMMFSTLVLLFMASGANATMALLKEFKTTYPNNKPLHSCKLCHSTQPQLNPYGIDLANAKNDMKGIEALDSDGDSFTNAQEIEKNTFPGDKNSVPAN